MRLRGGNRKTPIAGGAGAMTTPGDNQNRDPFEEPRLMDVEATPQQARPRREPTRRRRRDIQGAQMLLRRQSRPNAEQPPEHPWDSE